MAQTMDHKPQCISVHLSAKNHAQTPTRCDPNEPLEPKAEHQKPGFFWLFEHQKKNGENMGCDGFYAENMGL